ncbi:hypothetical protein N7509_007470 [Penicillium cosmopolitanum]|uniref:Telomerase reverse transcriptase n=1 Tax=Penicillium cosmopolitanum TaxID=1131564 RepID=A0A9W9VZG0_9EURO|nr:uncharacterized protein N7509_007470 [Penicillium cosmopolitanum]KAJ5391980.1 hypothetical protein N7509_007470 [Penicillium cosmopolitanum]
MAKKRKRPGHRPTSQPQTCISSSRRFNPAGRNPHPTHPVISLYYRDVFTLRQYLLRRLPLSSKLRRRRIASLGVVASDAAATKDPISHPLVDLLDTTLVGVLKQPSPKLASERQQAYCAFTQSQSRSILVGTDTGPVAPQSELIDYVISNIFGDQSSYRGPQHVLAHGFQHASENSVDSGIPGVAIQFPNRNVQALKQTPWTDVLGLLGQNGEEIMIHLLLDCGIFVPLDASKGIFYQLSGVPLSGLEKIHNLTSTAKKPTAVLGPPKIKHPGPGGRVKRRSPNTIIFLRRRVLYCRLAGGSKQKLPFGLGSSHVLNRFSSLESTNETIHFMKYLFPRQFGLDNVLTVSAERNNNNQAQSHEFRENEISKHDDHRFRRLSGPAQDRTPAITREQLSTKLPKRLRGQVLALAQKLRVRHARCSYGALLQHYCPADSNGPWRLPACPENKEPRPSTEEALVTQPQSKSPATTQLSVQPEPNNLTLHPRDSIGPKNQEKQNHMSLQRPRSSVTDFATPAAAVSAFCRAVLQKLLPPQFFGDGSEGDANCRIVLKHVDSFIKMRRYENISLHSVCKNIKVTKIPWLIPPNLQDQYAETQGKVSLSDFQKRTELLHEFVYYVFDSIIIPLIRTNFYVTESQTHRNRLFFFRHDVWRHLSEQPLADLKSKTFEKIDPESGSGQQRKQYLGYGSLRLLPKSTGVRPILNLGKKVLREYVKNGKKKAYFVSINRTIAPISNMLMYERQRDSKKVGSSLISMGDLHPRLKAFKGGLDNRSPSLHTKSTALPKLYFVKLDIQACFDNIPQKRLLRLITDLVTEESYRITKHVEIKPSVNGAQGKPFRKWVGRAAPLKQQQHLPDYLASENQIQKPNTVYVDDTEQKVQDADWLLNLLGQHVQNNLVKIGKEYFRQRNGIPQGSVLSSLLCNFFLADLERNSLGFLQPTNSLLMRFVDDFLLITTDVNQATQFLHTMLHVHPSYGVVPSQFHRINRRHTHPRLEGSTRFPYLGCLIDTHTLEIHQDQDRALEGGDLAATALSNSLTVETSALPGHTLRRKVLASFRQQMHPMFIDDRHNSRAVVLGNLYTRFVTVAMKMYRYMKSLQGRSHPKPPIIIQTIHTLMLRAFAIIEERRSSSGPGPGPTATAIATLSCFVKFSHVRFLAASAFRFVLKRKQTRYGAVLQWLDAQWRDSRPVTDREAVKMGLVVQKGNALFEDWRF